MYEKMLASVAEYLHDCDEMCYVKVQDGKCTYVDEIFYEPTMKVWVDKEIMSIICLQILLIGCIVLPRKGICYEE
jgi:hypothetical protein